MAPSREFFFSSFCFCINVMPYYWCNALLARGRNIGSKDIMSGCRVWVHCCDQPLCLLSKWLSMWRWYHWKKTKQTCLTGFRVSVPVLEPLLLRVSLFPVRRRLVSLLDVLKFYRRSGCLVGNISSWISRCRQITWLVIKKKRAEVNSQKDSRQIHVLATK